MKYSARAGSARGGSKHMVKWNPILCVPTNSIVIDRSI
jgi:hypothetical protein